MADVEIPQLVIKEAHVYQIPPRASNKGVTAASWDLSKPVFSGQLKVTVKGSRCFVKLFDKQTGQEFAVCPVDAYPGKAVEAVTDSSRYFVLRLDDGSGRHAFVGMGFQERTDAFDFNAALLDHFKREEHADAADKPYVPTHQVGALSGPIKVNVKIKGKDGKSPKKTTPSSGGLAPPPGGLGASFQGLSLAPPPGGLGASFPSAAASTPAAGPNPFAAAPASTTTKESNPFMAAESAASSTPATDSRRSSNPFLAAQSATPAGDSSNPFGAPAAADPFGAFASAPAASDGQPNDWVKF